MKVADPSTPNRTTRSKNSLQQASRPLWAATQITR